jgi:hypothetical protein
MTFTVLPIFSKQPYFRFLHPLKRHDNGNETNQYTSIYVIWVYIHVTPLRYGVTDILYREL